MRSRFVRIALGYLAVMAITSAASAQIYSPSTEGKRSPQAEKAAKAATPPAYDPHDLSGVWWGNNSRTPTTGTILMGNPVPEMTALGKQMYATNKPSQGKDAVPPAKGNDPLGVCDPIGYPRNLLQNTRSFEFIQAPTKIIQLFEWNFAVRQIFMDGRKIPADVDPRWFGYAVGHWDGDALVIDSAGYNDKTWLDGMGDPHSEDMTLQERWQHPDTMTLQVTMTLTDPKIYTKPWVSAKPILFKLQLPRGVTEMEEAYCVPSEEEYFNEHVRNPAGGITK